MTQRARDMSELDDVFLVCRTTTHAWEPVVTFPVMKGRREVWETTWICQREVTAKVPNPSTRTDPVIMTGRHRGELLAAPTRTYPDGYLLEPGAGKNPKRAARAELVGRMPRKQGRRRLRAV